MENERSRNRAQIEGEIDAFLRYEGAQDLLKQVVDELHFIVSRVTKISKGGNNGIFVLEDVKGHKLIAKFYQRDHRTRLDREYRANSFLSERKFHVAKPILCNNEKNYGVYSYETGDYIEASQATAEHVDGLGNFLVQIQQYKPSDVSEPFMRCVSAMANLQEVVDDNTRRIADFQNAIKDGSAHPLVVELLAQSPYEDNVAAMTNQIIAQASDRTWHINQENRRLSPVDFGFHNALFRSGEPPVILDLEYFGWDDPLHPVADFIAHDQTLGLPDDLRQRFIERYSETKQLPDSEQRRLADLIKLTEVKWMAIYLLSLTPKYLATRAFAAGGAFDPETYIRQQVRKIEERKQAVLSSNRADS